MANPSTLRVPIAIIEPVEITIPELVLREYNIVPAIGAAITGAPPPVGTARTTPVPMTAIKIPKVHFDSFLIFLNFTTFLAILSSEIKISLSLFFIAFLSWALVLLRFPLSNSFFNWILSP